jgi:hypothetical protein
MGAQDIADIYKKRNRSRAYRTKSENVVKTKRGKGKFTRISQKISGNNQKAGSANSRA